MKIGIINSGGDVQGLNAVISAIVKYGSKHSIGVLGFIKGWEGLLDMNYVELGLADVSGISHIGGTILKPTNKGRFAGKKGTGEENEIPQEILQLAKANFEKLGLEALLVLGGDGTLAAAKQLHDIGVNIIGVPKTIDNDLSATDQTFGYSTAVGIAVEAIDRLYTTAYSHDRFILVETMGRHVGWIALMAGFAAGVEAILIPEFAFSYDKLIEIMRARKHSGKNYGIIVVSEGAHAEGETMKGYVNSMQDTPEIKLGGIASHIELKINQLAPGEFDIRHVVLGHVQRGGTPDAKDRIISQEYGVAAVDALLNKNYGIVVCLEDNKRMVCKTISEVTNKLKSVSVDSLAFETAKKLGIYIGNSATSNIYN